MVETCDQRGQASNPDASVRIAALQVQIAELESQLESLSEALSDEKARSLALVASAARLSVIEAELSAESSARDAAGAVATAAVAELRELRQLRDILQRERDTACSERDIARAAAREAETRVAELEAKLTFLAVQGAENVLAPSRAQPVVGPETELAHGNASS